MEKGKYLCQKWQGFIQQIINNVTKGYYFYHYHVLPEKRHGKLPEIDQKIISRFNAAKSKDKRYHHKKSGLANYFYLRYDGKIIIMRSSGVEPCEELQRHEFFDIRKVPLEIRPVTGGELVLKIGRKANKGFTVYIERQCYKDIKYSIAQILDRKQKEFVKARFDRLNNLPAYAGIIKQKEALLRFILKQAKRHGLKLKRRDFRFVTTLHKYKVFIKD